MKTPILKMKREIHKLLIVLFLISIYSCSKDDGGEPAPKINPDAQDIDEIIAGLSYDASTLLNVQDTGGTSSERTLKDERTNEKGPTLGNISTCITKEYGLESNFDDVSILRPTNGIIWPGALVVGNEGMLDGAPDPFTLDRAPVTLRLDLP